VGQRQLLAPGRRRKKQPERGLKEKNQERSGKVALVIAWRHRRRFYSKLEEKVETQSASFKERHNSSYSLSGPTRSQSHSRFATVRQQPLTVKTQPLQFKLHFFNSCSLLFPQPAAGPAFTLGFVRTLKRQSIHSPPSSQRRSYAKRKMPPKKAVKEEKVLLGRPGNNLKSGIVCTGAGIAVI
jgi:hypothetical protein